MNPFTFFISYRREDTAPIALLLKHEIEKRLQFVRVLVDVETIEPGELFEDRLSMMIDQADATIALIGKNWMPRRDAADTKTRSKDYVVFELMESLNRPLKTEPRDLPGFPVREVIPLFINLDVSFSEFTIPDVLQPLTRRHALSVRYRDWPRTIGPTINEISRRFMIPYRPDAVERPKPDRGKARTQPLSDPELTAILRFDDYDGWYVDNFGSPEARYLCKMFEFDTFDQAASFMSLVSDHCKVLDHQPDWRNVHKFTTVSLTTWDAKDRITIYDINIALFMNRAAKLINPTRYR